MKKVNYLSALVVAGASLAASASVVSAQAIDSDSVQVGASLGDIEGISGVFTFAINLFYYLGWVGVILGVGLAIFGLIYKLINTDSEEAMKTVQGYLTKAVLIVVAGILLVSSGWIITTVAELINADTPGIDSVTPDDVLTP